MQIHPHPRPSRLSRFLAHEGGLSAVEYAIAAPIVIWLIMWIIEYGVIVTVSSMLSYSTNEAGRRMKTGYLQYETSKPSIRTREEMVKQTLLDLMAMWIRKGHEDEDLQITSVKKGTVNPPPGTISAGGSGELMLMTVTLHWKPITPAIQYSLPGYDGSKIPLTAYLLVKNEDF